MSDSRTKNDSWKIWQRPGLVFVALFGFIGLLLLVQSQAETDNLYLSPSTTSVQTDQTVDVEVRISPTAVIDGVEGTVTYDPEKLEYLEMDPAGSAFELELGQQSGGGGLVTFTRGSLQGGASGDALVTTISFKVLANSGSIDIGINGNSTSQGAYTNPETTGVTLQIAAGSVGTFFLSPETMTVDSGQNLTTEIRLDPGTMVNGAEVELSYDPDKLQFVSIDSSESAFELELGPQTGGDGTVTIVRGTLQGEISSEVLVAKVTFKALANSGTGVINIAGNATDSGSYTNPETFGATITFTNPNADNEAPVVNITSPKNDSLVAGDVNVQVSANDNVGVTKVELFVDGQRVDTVNQAPFNFTLDSLSFSNGNHELYARAFDAAGNTKDSTIKRIEIKNRPADINQDGRVSLVDFSLLVVKYGQSGSGLGRADINRDGSVNFDDFLELASEYGT